MRAPGKIPAGTVCDAVTANLDLLPTFAKLSGAQVPTDRAIDGHDISGLMRSDTAATSPAPTARVRERSTPSSMSCWTI